MSDRIWTPPKVVPKERKRDGGSYFDDEMVDTRTHEEKFKAAVLELIKEVNQHPDKVVFVASDDERHKMRAVFNSFKEAGMVQHWPTIKIDYGVPEGTLRVDWDRSE